MAKIKTCERCGTTNLEWRRTKYGKWLLWEIGALDTDEPHFTTCGKVTVAKPAPVPPLADNRDTCVECLETHLTIYMKEGFCIPCLDKLEAADKEYELAATISPIAAYAQLTGAVSRQGTSFDHDQLEHMISQDRNVLVGSLNALFKQTAIKLAANPQPRYGTPDSGALITVQPEARKPEPPKPAPVAYVKPLAKTSPTEPRNIPCSKCRIPNRITYSELMRGVDCNHCSQ
jgi:hypothetical protein